MYLKEKILIQTKSFIEKPLCQLPVNKQQNSPLILCFCNEKVRLLIASTLGKNISANKK